MRHAAVLQPDLHRAGAEGALRRALAAPYSACRDQGEPPQAGRGQVQPPTEGPAARGFPGPGEGGIRRPG